VGRNTLCKVVQGEETCLRSGLIPKFAGQDEQALKVHLKRSARVSEQEKSEVELDTKILMLNLGEDENEA
jgi:hypothetical protein